MIKIKYFLTAILLMFASSIVVNASENYGIYTDSNNVRWQYRYDNANIEKGLEISFYDKPNSVTSVTVPTLDNVKGSNSSISSSITKYVLVNYFTVRGNTPNSMSTDITNIDLSNITVINGVQPMINPNIETTITFAPSGTIIAEELIFTDDTETDVVGVFEGTKLNVNNLDKIVSIGNEAFKNVTFNSQNITLSSLDVLSDKAFQGTNVTIVDINTPIIGNAAFKECYHLEKVIIGDRVDELLAEVFMDDANLSVINFNNITKIGNYAFSGCTLFNVDIYNTKINTIGEAAFMNTIGYIRDLKLPDGVTQIGWRTFYNTGTSKANLNIVTEIGSEAFSECKNLTNVEFGKTEHVDYRAFYNDKRITDLTLGDNLYFVGTQAFSDCSISNLDLNNVERIDYEGFARNKLTELYLPKTFTYQYESNLFTENQITKATVAYDTNSSKISEEFRVMLGSNYSILTDLVVEPPYAEDEEINFDHAKFETFHLEYCSWYSCHGEQINDEINLANTYKNVIRPNYFYNLPALTNLTIGEGYEFIGQQAFFTVNPYGSYTWGQPVNKDDYKLTNIKLPETLKGIGAMAFYGNLVNDNVNINLPQSLEFIGYQTFFYCPGLKNVIDLKNLKYIGQKAFMHSGITEIYFRDKLEVIGMQVIFQCKDLKVIVFDCDYYAITNPYDHSFYSNINCYDHVYDLIEFTEKVQAEPQRYNYSVFMYKLKAKKLLMADTGWKKLTVSFLQDAEVDYMTLPKNLEEIGDNAFLNAVIKNDVIDMPDSVKTLGYGAFHSATLKIDQLPSSLVTIGDSAFYACDFNSDPIIPSSVTTIGRSAFMSTEDKIIHRNSFTINANLPINGTRGQTVNEFMYNTTIDYLYFGPEVVELPTFTRPDSEFFQMPVKHVVFEGLKNLPAKAFQECTKLESVDFSKDGNLKSIGKLAFYKANNLKEVKFNNNPENEIVLGEEAFRYTALTSIGKKDSGFDLTSNKFMLEGKFTFSNIPTLKEVYVPDGFNNNVINEYTFWDCKNLERADIGYNIELIKSYAFAGDSSLNKLFLWGDTEVIQEDEEKVTEASTKNIKLINEATYDFDFVIKDSISGETTIKKSDFTLVDEANVYNYTSKGSATYSFEYPYYINIEIDESVMDVGVEQNYILITIKDLDASMFTIPSNTDIYTYSTYDAKSWDEEYDQFRRNEIFNTNSTYYPLDEVLYLTSNRPEITVKNEDDDFDKSDLIVYALRRDGIILESDTWKEYTTHFARTNKDIKFEDYDAATADKDKIVYDTIVPEDVVDVSTENFASMTYEFVPKPGLISRREVVLNYVDKPTSNDVDTDLQPVLTVENVFTGSNLGLILIILSLGITGFIIAIRKLKKNKIYNN